MKFVFILGSGHCGSTLLDLLLDGHPRILGVGELLAQDFNKTEDPFWSGILDHEPYEIYRRRGDYLFGRRRFVYVKNKALVDEEAYRARILSQLEKAAAKKGASVVVDSSKNPDFVDVMTRRQGLDFVVIHLVRDGRGVFASYLKKYPGHPFFAMKKWFVANMKIELLLRRIAGKHVFVHYDSLVRNPQAELFRILSAVGLSYEPSMLRFREGEHHQIGGNRMKKETSQEIRSDNSWRTYLTTVQKGIFVLLFGWLNVMYRLRHE